ncbi:MAG TPA: flap endonuclease-1 [Candidatus Thermoplasmatota archaeon]|nr:flap endonuclease-1 [Candidatus Thermoplasmatota archaeon]
MGVDLADLTPGTPRRLDAFKGQAVAIDAYNTLYQFLSIIRQPDGTPLMDSEGRVTSHLSGLFYRLANLAEAGIKPVFVFDGKPNPLKFATLDERRERKAKAEQERQEAVAAGDTARAFSKAQQTSSLSRDMAQEAKDLLDALGMPWVQAPEEGEAQAAQMALWGDVWAAASQDYDSLLFGAPRLLRNLSVTGKRKLPGKNVSVEVEPHLLELEPCLSELEITREQLVAIGILVGTDYNPGIKGVGPKKGLKLVKQHGTLEKVLQHLEAEIPNAAEIQRLFLEPSVTRDYTLKWGAPDADAVTQILVAKHGFSKDRVEATLPRYQALIEARKQRSLDAFF